MLTICTAGINTLPWQLFIPSMIHSDKSDTLRKWLPSSGTYNAIPVSVPLFVLHGPVAVFQPEGDH